MKKVKEGGERERMGRQWRIERKRRKGERWVIL